MTLLMVLNCYLLFIHLGFAFLNLHFVVELCILYIIFDISLLICEFSLGGTPADGCKKPKLVGKF